FRRGLVAAATTALLFACLSFSAAPQVAAATACPTTLAFGTTVGCAIDAKGETDAFALNASAGDVAFVHAVGASGAGLEMDLDVRDPSGKTICSATAGPSAEVVCPLPAAGKYTVAVFDSGGDDTGAYRLDTQRVNKPVGAFALALGRPRQGLVGTAG